MVEVFEGKYRAFNKELGLDSKSMPWTVKWQYAVLTLGRERMRSRYEEIKEQVKKEIYDKLPLPKPKGIHLKKAYKQVPQIAMARLAEECQTIDERLERDLQFLYDSKEKTILGVATPNHIVITADQVADEIIKIIAEMNLQERDIFRNYPGSRLDTGQIDSPNGPLKLGVVISYGNEILTKAIRGSISIEVQNCMNELQFLEIKKTRLWNWQGLQVAYTRVLRIEKETDLGMRLRQMVEDLNKSAQEFASLSANVGKRKLLMEEAEAIITAVSSAYALGKKVVGAIVEDFVKSEHTVWDLAMAFTRVAGDEEMFKQKGQRSQARVSTAGTVLLALPTTELIVNCQKYLTVKKIPAMKIGKS